MMRYLSTFLMIVWPMICAAQTVTVRSGEHGDFTRLVFDLPLQTNWTVSPDREQQRISVAFSTSGLVVDTSRVFDRIDRNRIAAIATDPRSGEVAIELACDCRAQAFALRDRMLVVDIRPDPGGFEPQQEPGQAAASPWVNRLSEIRVNGVPGIGPRRQPNLLLPPFRDPDTRPVDVDQFQEADRIAAELTDPLSIGDQIAADLAIAVSRGLLEPSLRTGRPSHQSGEDGVKENPKAAATVGPQMMPQELAADLSNMDHKAAAKGRIEIGGEDCISDEQVDVSRWVAPADNINQVLSARRGAVFGEFDRIDTDAQRRLVEALIYYGFGAEARETVKLFSDRNSKSLLALSYIVDREPDPARVFANQTDCNGAAALWSVLSAAKDQHHAFVDHAAVLRTFEGLPAHLRTHLGPDLAQALSRLGHDDQASDVLRRLERSAGEETRAIALGKAQLELKEGDLVAAGNRLQPLSLEDGPEAPDAVVAMIELAERSGKPVPDRILVLSATYATEYRNSDEGSEFWQMYLRALLANGEFEKALEMLEEKEPESFPREQSAALYDKTLRMLAENADRLSFLKLATREIADHFLPLRVDTAVALSERLLQSGLPEVALTQLHQLDPAAETPESKRLLARTLLALGQPEEAEIILIGQRGEEATRLRAEARRQMGDHDFAHGIYAEIGDADEARQSAWLAGDWQKVAQDRQDALSRTAELLQKETVTVDPSAPTLSMADSLSAESATARETLRSLLDATRIVAEN